MIHNMRAGLVGLVGAASLAQAHWQNSTGGVVYTTVTATELTTYCPAATTFTHGQSTYTVTEATTLTIPCPGGCEVTKPVTTVPAQPTQPAGNGNGTVVYTTETATELTTYCPGATTLTHGQSTYTVTEATTLTIPCPGGCEVTKPVTTVPVQPTQTAGTVVYTTETATELTTYCPGATTLTHDQTTYTVTEATSLTIPCPGGCVVTKPVTTKPAEPTGPTTPGSPVECAEMCYDAYNACRVKPDSNKSTCASEYASCLGYNPFQGNGSLATPTACSAGAPSPSTMATLTSTPGVTGPVGTGGVPPPAGTTTPGQIPGSGAAGLSIPAAGLLALGAAILL